jgi:putative PIN family toxin of toxin-antitoxin system
MNIVLDTNILVSGILFPGHPRRIMTLVSQGYFTNHTSPDLLGEVETVLRRPKFGLDPVHVSSILMLFRDTFEIVHPTRRLHVVAADPADNRVLEAAAAAGAEVVVSGDAHLLRLRAWEGIRIVAFAQFLAQYSGRTGE